MRGAYIKILGQKINTSTLPSFGMQNGFCVLNASLCEDKIKTNLAVAMAWVFVYNIYYVIGLAWGLYWEDIGWVP